MATRLPDSTRNTITDAIVDLLDAGAGAGTVKIYSGTQPAAGAAATGTLLATFTLSDPAFGAASSGTATANSIAAVNGAATGTPGWFRGEDSTGADCFDGKATGPDGGGELELNVDQITSGVQVSVTSWTFTTGSG